uniref:Uncharacterized protein n=1 Tax=Oryza brachyantha TaxID=4533 RepID=J3LVE9_ORYBR
NLKPSSKKFIPPPCLKPTVITFDSVLPPPFPLLGLRPVNHHCFKPPTNKSTIPPLKPIVSYLFPTKVHSVSLYSSGGLTQTS